MGTVAEACRMDYDALVRRAIAVLNEATERLVRWVELVRDPKSPWAFRWAVDSVREANVAATNYIVGAADRCGVLDRILSARVSGFRDNFPETSQ